MKTVYNIRGANGSGKTTLVRSFLGGEIITGCERGGPVDLNSYLAPTKKEPGRHLRAEGYVVGDVPFRAHRLGIVGQYRTPTGGMDTVPSFGVQQDAILYLMEHLHCDNVLCEGVLSSTVYGSWAEFDRQLEEHHTARFAYVYLNVPVEVCLERVRRRQEASGKVREIKVDLVVDKVKAVAATRERAIRDGRLVYDLPGEEGPERLREHMLKIISGTGEIYRVAG